MTATVVVIPCAIISITTLIVSSSFLITSSVIVFGAILSKMILAVTNIATIRPDFVAALTEFDSKLSTLEIGSIQSA